MTPPNNSDYQSPEWKAYMEWYDNPERRHKAHMQWLMTIKNWPKDAQAEMGIDADTIVDADNQLQASEYGRLISSAASPK